MIIYGTAILAVCHLLGVYLGNALGIALGVQANVGGVAIAMILLILSKELLAKRGHLPQVTQFGVLYWSGMYSRLWLPCRQAKTSLLLCRAGCWGLLFRLPRLSVRYW